MTAHILRKFRARLCILALVPFATAAVAPPAHFDRQILNAHNREREALNLTPISWNPGLARSARTWAEFLAASGRFEHAPRQLRANAGENLWAGTRDAYSADQMVDAWASEKRLYLQVRAVRGGRSPQTGHYAQIVSVSTTQVGCAKASGAHDDVLVCRYF